MTEAINTGPGPHPSPAVLPAVWKLLSLRWQISWNSFRRTRLVRKIFTVIGYLALLGFVGFIFWASWQLLGFLRSPELTQYVGDTRQFVDAVPGLLFTAFFFGILLTSFGVLLQALYLSGDMDFLLAAPVPIRAVFITKLLQAILPNFGLGIAFGLPVLFGLGASRGYNFLYYILVVLMFVLVSLAAAGLAALLVMLVARVFPARRVVEVLGFVGAIFSMICSQTGNLMNSAGDEIDVTNQQVSQTVGLLSRFDNPLNPLSWPAKGLLSLGEGSWLPGLGLSLLSLGLAGFIFWVSLQTAERWYYTGWAGMQAVTRKKKATRAGSPAINGAAGLTGDALERSHPLFSRLRRLVERTLAAPIRGIIWKDSLVLRRDLRQFSQLITPLIFGVIYGFIFLRRGGEVPAGQGEAPAWFMGALGTLLNYGSILLAIFVGWMLLQRLGGMGFSAEGKNYWLLKTSPLSARQILTAKFLVAYLPSLALSILFLVGYSILQKTPFPAFLYSILALGACLGGMAGIEVAFGAAGANFTWEDPRRMNAGNMGCLGSILAVLYVPLNLALFFVPLVVINLMALPQILGFLVGGLLGLGACIAAVIIPMRLLEPRVNKLGE